MPTKLEKKVDIRITSFLPHECGYAFDQEMTGLTYEESGAGAITGGTGPAFLQEVRTNYAIAQMVIRQLDGASIDTSVGVTLDTPYPTTSKEFTLKQHPPFDVMTYPIPVDQNGVVMQQWGMMDAYKNDREWMSSHVDQRTQPGRHIIFAHHTVGAGLEPVLKEEGKYGDGHIVAVRFHSALLEKTRMEQPKYFEKVYGDSEGTQKLLQLQRDALQAADLVVFPTGVEHDASIKAVSGAGIMSEDDMQKKSVTVPIPIDTSKFAPDTSGELRRAQIAAFNKQFPQYSLDPDKTIIGSILRLDHEKNPWAMIEAFADFLTQSNGNLDEMPIMLVLGGKAIKPGIAERHQQMLDKLATYPPQIRNRIIVPGVPVPHEDVVHMFDMQIYPSWEEGFNISEKQSRSAGHLVALSDIQGHRATNSEHSALFFEAGDSPDVFHPVFEAATNLDKYEDVRREGMQQVKQFSPEAVCEGVIYEIDQRFPGFFMTDGYENIHIPPQS